MFFGFTYIFLWVFFDLALWLSTLYFVWMTWSLDSHLSLWVIVFLRHGSIWNSEDLHGLIAAACRGINSFCLDNYVCVQFTWLISLTWKTHFFLLTCDVTMIDLFLHQYDNPRLAWTIMVMMKDDIKIYFDFACILLGSLMFVWFSIAYSFRKFVL